MTEDQKKGKIVFTGIIYRLNNVCVCVCQGRGSVFYAIYVGLGSPEENAEGNKASGSWEMQSLM